ncbi:MAG TPA: WecB/TagA/CpsF family glycosyltransferase [Acidobacteriaceae bacterium]|nr:WecB/TagA/CpsF family glycosyltransferase [Acidobacteriaceae bacterium]
MEAHRDPELRAIARNALLVLPDGMPTVWLGRSQGHSAMDRVFGPELMLEVFACPEFRDTTHFFWGGADGVADRLRETMQRRFPDVKIVGAAAPPFRDLTEQEQHEFVAQIAQLQPDIIWVGVSTPKQDKLMAELSPLLDARLMIGVGAAFLFHTGALQDSPRWMKQTGLQWLHRFLQEPSRLWRRYLTCVPAFAFHSLLQISGLRKYPFPSNVIAEPRTTSAQPVPR